MEWTGLGNSPLTATTTKALAVLKSTRYVNDCKLVVVDSTAKLCNLQSDDLNLLDKSQDTDEDGEDPFPSRDSKFGLV